jgi:hypothetical protein
MLEKRRHHVHAFAEEAKLRTLAREGRTRIEVGKEGKLREDKKVTGRGEKS